MALAAAREDWEEDPLRFCISFEAIRDPKNEKSSLLNRYIQNARRPTSGTKTMAAIQKILNFIWIGSRKAVQADIKTKPAHTRSVRFSMPGTKFSGFSFSTFLKISITREVMAKPPRICNSFSRESSPAF